MKSTRPLTQLTSLSSALLVAASIASTSAQAEDALITHDAWLLEPELGTFYANGIGSPTVAYDDSADLWVMYFETQFAPPDATCRQGRWGIGRATSPDGLSWTVDPDMVIEPEEDTYYACVIAHPTVIYDGDVWHLWFKAHQTNIACVDTGLDDPDWGCNAVTGVGYAASVDGEVFETSDEPIINLSSFGFPAVTRVNGVYRMLLAFSNARNQIFELWQSVSTDDGLTWSTPQFVIGPGFASWVENEIYNPSLTCDENAPVDEGPFILFAGGRDTEPQTGGPPELQSAGLGRAFSTNAVDWYWDGTEPLILWDLASDSPAPPARDWRHWDVVRVGEEYLFFFSAKDDLDRNRIGLAYTYDTIQTSLDEAAVSNRICAEPNTGAPGDTDQTSDTEDDPNDTEEGTESGDTDETDKPPGDTDTGEPKKKCGCNATGAHAGWLLLLPALWRRRRA